MTYLLDTHAWIWWYMNPEKLSQKVIDHIGDINNYERMLISAISIWEFCKLIEKKRLIIHGNAKDWLSQAFDLPKLRIAPLTPIIAYESTVLPLPIHNDPADQIIIATARIEDAIIITKDELLQKYKHVTCFW